jgi:putative oxidoreductase
VNTSPSFLAPWQSQLLAVLRIVTGYMVLLHGTAKLLHEPKIAMFDQLDPFSLAGFAGILELVGGFLILVGLFTRPVAFILSGEMAVAYFIGHASLGNPLLPLLNQGELAVAWCFVFLYLAAAGAGAWSVDNLLSRPKAATASP